MRRAANLRAPGHGLHSLWERVRVLWHGLRSATGDDAYECYCAHQRRHHPHEPLMSRRVFCAEATGRKWNGVSRCC